MSYFRALSSCLVLLLAWSHHKEKCFPTDTSRAASISIPANKAACVSSHSTVNVSDTTVVPAIGRQERLQTTETSRC